MTYVSFKLLDGSDAELLSNLLLASPFDYARYFHPFDFHVSAVSSKLDSAIDDKYFGMVLENSSSNRSELVGFYMLRGMDEGYLDPMYGVFIDQHWQNKGIARLSLCHAECFCKINLYKRLLLKVHSRNHKAKSLYESFGFKAISYDTKIENTVFFKDL